MQTTQMSSKGQVIIPKDIRTRRHWLPGTRLVAEETPQGVLLRTVRDTNPQTLDAGLAALHTLANHRGRPKTLTEMEAAVAAEARKRTRRAAPVAPRSKKP